MYRFEEELAKQGFATVAGVDEAGRGPLAGPVVAAAVILPQNCTIEGIRDSKRLTPRRREKLFDEIVACAQVGVGQVDERVIDSINIYQATRLAMRRAVQALKIVPQFLLIDGPLRLDLAIRSRSIIGGDDLCTSIAAASIIAKVTRDRIMQRYHELYPLYYFAKHKGYPTRLHIQCLRELGPSPIHRRTFGPVRKCLASA